MLIELGDDNTVSVTHHVLVDATQGYVIDALYTPRFRLSLFSINQLHSAGSTATFLPRQMLHIIATITDYNHRLSYQRSLCHMSQRRKRTHGINLGWTSNHTADHSSKHRFKHTRCTYNVQAHSEEENTSYTHHWIYESISDHSSVRTSELISKPTCHLISECTSECTATYLSMHTCHLISECTSACTHINLCKPTNRRHKVAVHLKDFHHLTVKTMASALGSHAPYLRAISLPQIHERRFDVHRVHPSQPQATVHSSQGQVDYEALWAGTLRCMRSILYSHIRRQQALHTIRWWLYPLHILIDASR